MYNKIIILMGYQMKWILFAIAVGLIILLGISLPLAMILIGDVKWYDDFYKLIFIVLIVFGGAGWLYGLGRGLYSIELSLRLSKFIGLVIGLVAGIVVTVTVTIEQDSKRILEYFTILIFNFALSFYLIYSLVLGGRKRLLDRKNIKKELKF